MSRAPLPPTPRRSLLRRREPRDGDSRRKRRRDGRRYLERRWHRVLPGRRPTVGRRTACPSRPCVRHARVSKRRRDAGQHPRAEPWRRGTPGRRPGARPACAGCPRPARRARRRNNRRRRRRRPWRDGRSRPRITRHRRGRFVLLAPAHRGCCQGEGEDRGEQGDVTHGRQRTSVRERGNKKARRPHAAGASGFSRQALNVSITIGTTESTMMPRTTNVKFFFTAGKFPNQ
jgi:hypothetical protein